MYNLIRFYNQNRKKIFKVILIIASIIGLIQLLNYFSGKNINIKNESNITNDFNYISSSVMSNKSEISGDTIPKSQLAKASNIIDNFINYCNNGEIEEAYNLLSQDCKNEIYTTLELFKNTYYTQIFNGEKKIYTMQNWMGDTYSVRIKEDILATGKVQDSALQDYITIVEEDNEEKLNINNYIGKKQINETTENENMSITVISKNTYMDYEVYNIQVENNSNKDILLDDKQSTTTIYLEDNNNIKYAAQSYELLNEDLLINEGYTKNLSIKFTNSYSLSRKINYLTFSKIILDNKEYEKYEDKTQYDNICQLQINV